MKPLLLAPGVEEEIAAAAAYYDLRHPGLGARFLQAVDEALERMTETPQAHAFAGSSKVEEGFRQVRVRRFPYHLVFREGSEAVLVLACAHVRREPGYWGPALE